MRLQQKLLKPRASPLILDLPAELRNRVYEYVLVDPDSEPLLVTRRGHTLPGILRTCRQPREEGTKIYFDLNSFQLTFTSLSFEPQPKQWIYSAYSAGRVEVILEGMPTGDNLIAWLSAYHNGTNPYRVSSFVAFAAGKFSYLYQYRVREVWEDAFETVDKKRDLPLDEVFRLILESGLEHKLRDIVQSRFQVRR